MLTFNVENWSDIVPEIKELFPLHYEEVAPDKDKIELDPDYEEYARLDDLGMLCTVTARHEGKLVGYSIAFIRTHIHYKKLLCAFVDIYFLKKEYRKGFNGFNLIERSDNFYKDRGVQKIFTSTKTILNIGVIFEKLGYNKAEHAYTKYIGV